MPNGIMPDYTENHSWGVLQFPCWCSQLTGCWDYLYTDEETSQYSSGYPSCTPNSAEHQAWGLRFVGLVFSYDSHSMCFIELFKWHISSVQPVFFRGHLLKCLSSADHLPCPSSPLSGFYFHYFFLFPSKISSHRQESANVFPLHFPCTEFQNLPPCSSSFLYRSKVSPLFCTPFTWLLKVNYL